ncbi:putative short-chain dehydrogenase/reductase family 42E member 2 isoform X2 [Syngnathoides biaculeatus]|uniref:putative short-chain dehydrogenase/reductase family 42E member 2 isoform X2 n=1 Tax=Syngnathoides biaculeatus TaxID=300417 RepID=UPI002ADDFEB3|nr:putative short-chain dehydrogenase/reductase family 42E member 2 isoform X2 [Syngnathoides biaculeatus]
MELCGPNTSDSGGSLCHVKRLPRHAASLCRLPPPRARPSRVNPAPPGAARRGSSAGTVLVTGGGGYFGFRLGRELAGQGAAVILLDMSKPSWDIPDGAVFYQADIRDYSALFHVCEGVDCVFHSASYGMSGPEQLRKEQVESVNVGGTTNVINVCKERSIPRLVYTSTTNAVFAGEPIEDGDEASVPRVPPHLHVDHYSRTKAIAEQMVLSANGCALKGGGGVLRSCVLRPCGIYGPGERRHLPRVMVNVERRLFSFRFGDRRARMNWVHVDNLVLAHTLAADALTAEKGCVASGQAYFINDGLSVNLFEWLTPLFEKLGQSRPPISLPLPLVYSAGTANVGHVERVLAKRRTCFRTAFVLLPAILVEYLHIFLRPVMDVPLLFTRSEVRNIAVSHTFKIDKARRDLGYRPKSYSLADSVDRYLESRRGPSCSPAVRWARRLHGRGAALAALGALLLVLSCVLWKGLPG